METSNIGSELTSEGRTTTSSTVDLDGAGPSTDDAPPTTTSEVDMETEVVLTAGEAVKEES